MKSNLLNFFLCTLATIVCNVFIACGDEDETTNDNSIASERKITKIIGMDKYGTCIFSFTYDKAGIISQIYQECYDDEEEDSYYVDYVITNSAISWSSKNKNYVAYLENGKAQKMTMKDHSFYYDSKGRLEVIKADYYSDVKLTWDNNDNITKMEEMSSRGEVVDRIEYSYTNHKAYMLAYFIYFNPLTEFDRLDCLWENALFYTGACGKLSNNLPEKATLTDWNNGKHTRTYNYQFDSKGYPIAVIIHGEDSDLYGYPVSLQITWD